MIGFDYIMCPNILIVYDNKKRNTERLAQAVAKGTKKVPGINVELKEVELTISYEAFLSDGCSFGSPILKNITTELVIDSIATEGAPSHIYKTHANKFGETLSKQVV